jgi:hypothetical protein
MSSDAIPAPAFESGNQADSARITAGAIRMRASRERRRAGMRSLTIELRNKEINRLIELGYLQSVDRESRNGIVQALYRFLDRTLGNAHHGRCGPPG